MSDMRVTSKPLTRRTLRVRTTMIQSVSAAVLLRTIVRGSINAMSALRGALIRSPRILCAQYESTEMAFKTHK